MNAKSGAAGAVFCLLVLAAIAFWAPLAPWPFARQGAFVAAAAFIILELMAIGVSLGRGPAGVIIDSRDCMSLSKLQACAWTVLVLSGLLVAEAFNISLNHPGVDPNFIPPDLLVAMGISATSLAATPALLSLKTAQTPSAQSIQTASAQLTALGGGANAAVPNVGALMTNTSRADASWTDMLTGDEVGNFATPDLGKIQQFLVTLLLVGLYGVLIFDTFGVKGPVKVLPPLDQSFIWLMGVSHASYLAYKAAPHTNSDPAGGANPAAGAGGGAGGGGAGGGGAGQN
jgi:hypothetical protein